MKKILIVFTLVSLILLIPVYALGAIDNFGDDYATTDTWFTITPDKPYIEAHYRNLGYTTPETLLGAEYFQNDQTFADLNIYTRGEDNKTYIDGSYLTGFGLFAGLEVYSHTYPGYSFQDLTISPGYRLALDKQSYVAVSVDYYSSEGLQDILDNEVNVRYYNDNMKLSGDFVSYTKPIYGTSTLSAGINYQITKSVVVGGTLVNNEASKSYRVGGTFSSDMLIIDGRFDTYSPTSGSSSNQINLSGMFLLGDNFKIGLQYLKNSEIDNAALTLKAKAAMEKSSFTLKFTPENDSFISSMSLSYECQL
ncbi:MAG TPA: hypothetical protein VHY08_08785 [Bacillota bacterium]|nr:hypothetical protein [Bacillota bacterium]